MSLPALVAPGPPLSTEQVTRYARHLLLPAVGPEGQRRLLNARVAVVGAGGLGSPSLLYLAAAGVGSITVIDDDSVDATNLQRQVIHDAMSVGLSKVESAVDRVRGLNPDVTVRGRQVRITSDNAIDLLRGHDLVLDGSDNFETRYAVDEACAELGLPLVWAAVYRTAAHLTTFWTGAPDGTGVGLRDLFPEPPPPGSVPACGDAGVLGALVGQVGSMMASEAIKLVTGTGRPLLGRVLYIDSLLTTQREIPLAPSARYSPEARAARALPDPTPTAVQAEVSPRDLADALEGGRTPFVLDVRESAELDFGVIEGATHVPLVRITDGDVAALGIPYDREVVVVCKAGPRASLAASTLTAHGYDDVRVLTGGMIAWAHDVDPTMTPY
ncbi:ThiF family adenylyltransferase [Janibacter sp. YIM B02568]|uniref:ThiF family adenylyltransferase n=1 Tax=Janibacter endophyticus TaxID=2806261 RepID=UPI00195133FC|nr:ThiF family adenylyltransferase [Janibacter endophyticus]MBM6546822.1 ThiF family adenylyltransferase [Janibacter endophyticus]